MDEIGGEVFKLREQRQQCTVDTVAGDAQIERINEMQDFVREQNSTLTAFGESHCKAPAETDNRPGQPPHGGA